MAAPHSPLGSRRRLGAELRRMRTESGLTLDDVAEQMTCSTSKISRLETGKGLPKVPDVRELMRIYGVTGEVEQHELLRLVHDGREHGWWESLTDGVQPEPLLAPEGRYVALESDATSIWSFEITLVHGLLQTEGYMRAVIAPLLQNQTPEAVDQLVKLRSRRQGALRRRTPSPLAMIALIDEAVLRRQVGGADTMIAQLEHLLAVSNEFPNVRVRVLPFEVGLIRAHAGPFMMLTIPEELGSDVAYIEGHHGERFIDSKSDIGVYREIFDDALGMALDEDDSRRLIARYIDMHRHNETGGPG